MMSAYCASCVCFVPLAFLLPLSLGKALLPNLADLVAVLLVLIYPGVFLFWFVIHLNIEYWRRLGKRSYWVACSVWPATWIPLIAFREEIFRPRIAMPAFIVIIGMAAAIGAAYVGRQAAKVIRVRTLVGIPELEPEKNRQPILETGIYGRTRNPIYLAHWLIVLAAAAVTGMVANWVLFITDCVVLPLLILAEERELLKRYGPEFRSYMKRVPRFFPQMR
jgi:protein-S-isoprenylcysteine O-methyltransferase Ste14